ncbi:AbfB domain-containing protein [Actinoplanes sp. HUAS TT8]|uniref:AbfB domain-containing protein n=1 Tax=Actinoplanes sp. HUAS TT8 TaxID=3447453 RepID=UPI003F5275E3
MRQVLQEANYMPEDDSPEGLRVGGWLPPYSPDANSRKAPVRSTPPASFPPAPIPGFPGWNRRSGPFRRRAALVAVAIATLGVAGVTAASLGSAEKEGDPTFLAGGVPPAPPPAQTVVVAPIPSVGSLSPSSRPPFTGSAPTTTHVRHQPAAKPTPSPSTTTTTPPAVTLRVGTQVTLPLADHPDHRVRHRNFLGRIDAIGASSNAADRADSVFTVRTGLGNSGCVSFESVNYPGYFLRHQNFVIKLNRQDPSDLYAQDATFCPVTIRSGAALVLRSTNYPKRFVTESDGRLYLSETTADRALALVPGVA